MAELYRNKYAQKTIYDELIENGDTFESKLKDYLNEIYDSRVKFLKRQAGKGMADILEELDTHVVDRATHMNQTANIAAIIADNLGLNSMIARYGMRAHDCGHPFGSHEGEEVLNEIGILYHCGFFHHNAKGIDVALSEDIVGKYIDAALNSILDDDKREAIKNDPEKMKRLEDDAWYFLEFIVGHDGEATKENANGAGSSKKFSSIKESVLYYTSKSNREDDYKAKVTTLEAVIAKPADVIAYLKSDVENAFRKGIIKEFSNDYLDRVGELLFEKDEIKLSREERIKKVKNYLRQIEKDKLRESKKDVYYEGGIEVLNAAESIVDDLQSIGIYTYNKDADSDELDRVNAYIRTEIDKYKIKRMNEGLIDQNALNSEINKLTDYIHKLLKVRKSVVEAFAEDIKNELIKDYSNNTNKQFERIQKEVEEEEKSTGNKIPDDEVKLRMMQVMNFSDRVSDIMYGENGLKVLNYREYVQHTKREFQIKELPKAALKAIKMCSESLVKSGVIRDKFYDTAVLKYINDENVIKAMKLPVIDENEYIKYKEKLGINEFRKIKRFKRFVNKVRYLEKKQKLKTLGTIKFNRDETCKDIIANTQRQAERFAIACEDVYYAIPNTIKTLVMKAVSGEYKPGQYLGNEEQERINKIRTELRDLFTEKGGMAITIENLEKYIDDKIQHERTVNFASNVANELAIKYIGGFGNVGIKALLKNNGFLNDFRYKFQDKPLKEKNESVSKLIDKYDKKDREKTEKEKIQEGLERAEQIKIQRKVPPIMVIPSEEKERE